MITRLLLGAGHVKRALIPFGLQLKQPLTVRSLVPVRFGHDHGPRTLQIVSSNYQWRKMKDLFHLYTMLGAIISAVILGVGNIFIGSATLEEIPEGYEPKHWEYTSHFVSRFMARYLLTPPQQDYEKNLALLYQEDSKRRHAMLVREIEKKMAEREDYKGYYYISPYPKYVRRNRENAEDMKTQWGYK